MTLRSDFHKLTPVSLPYKNRQYYMHGFDLSNPKMPEGFEDYQSIVEKLCSSAGAKTGKAYLTVDEKVIQAGKSQRRPGPHVDGCYLEHLNSWGGGGNGWNHSCNAVPFARMPVIVASDVPLCKAWVGEFDGEPTVGQKSVPDGDLSPLDLPEGVILQENMGFLLSPDCIHESMVVDKPTRRTFIRIALPPSYSELFSEGKAIHKKYMELQQ